MVSAAEIIDSDYRLDSLVSGFPDMAVWTGT